MESYKQEFIEFMVESDVLKFDIRNTGSDSFSVCVN